MTSSITEGVAIDRTTGAEWFTNALNQPDIAAQFGQVMGHAGGGSMRRNYNHQLFAWRDTLLGFEPLTVDDVELDGAAGYFQPTFLNGSSAKPGLQQRVQSLINLATGHSVLSASQLARVPESDTSALMEAVDVLAQVGRFNTNVLSGQALLAKLPKRFLRQLLSAVPRLEEELKLSDSVVVDALELAESANSERELSLSTSDEVSFVCGVLKTLEIDCGASRVQARGRKAIELAAKASEQGMIQDEPIEIKRGRQSSSTLLMKLSIPVGHSLVANRLQFMVLLLLMAQTKPGPASHLTPMAVAGL